MAAAGTSGFASMKERGYFLLLDRLQCTLEHKIDHWRNFQNAMDVDGKKGRSFLAERLHVAFDVAAALSYLHANHIIYRDLKPDSKYNAKVESSDTPYRTVNSTLRFVKHSFCIRHRI